MPMLALNSKMGPQSGRLITYTDGPRIAELPYSIVIELFREKDQQKARQKTTKDSK